MAAENKWRNRSREEVETTGRIVSRTGRNVLLPKWWGCRSSRIL